MDRTRLGLLISGGGRTALNLADACARGAIDASVALVIAHRDEVDGVARCREAGLRVAVIPKGPDLDDRIDAALVGADVGLVCLCGYLRRFRVGTRWRGQALNIHPGLLPRFGGTGMYGLAVHRAVLAAGVAESGCTVHEVDEEYDRGPTVLERRCPVIPGDSAETLAERVFREECAAYPLAVARILARSRGAATETVTETATA